MNQQETSGLLEIETQLLFLLSSPTPDWQQLEKIFSEYFPLVPIKLVQRLGVHYLHEMALNQAKENDTIRACLLNYQAYDFSSSSPLTSEAFANWHRQVDSKTPPFPKPLIWSSAAISQLDSMASMDSPLIHAWVYEEKKLPVEIIICGRGIDWVKKQIDTAILATILSLTPKPTDILLEGFTRLSLDRDERKSALDPDSLLMGVLLQTHISENRYSVGDPLAAMIALVQELIQLENKTGLVKVIRRPDVERSDLIQSIDSKKADFIDSPSDSDSVYIWQNSWQGDKRIVAPYALHELNLQIPLTLTKTDIYQRLHDLYQNELVRTATADALRRLNFYAGNLSDHTKELELYIHKDTRHLLPESITLTHQIDYETGLAYRRENPDEISRDEYYGKHVPKLVRMDIQWIKKMKKLLRNLASAIGQPDSSLNRLTMARLFNAALRDLPLTGNSEIAHVYQEWKDKVQQFLWTIWHGTLKRNMLQELQLSTRQFFFNLTIEQSEAKIVLRPFFLVDSQTSLFVFDPNYSIPIIRSLYDYLTHQPFTPVPDKARDEFRHWQQQVQIGNNSESTSNLLKHALSLDPVIIVKDIIDTYRKPYINDNDLVDLLHTTITNVDVVFSHKLSMRMWNHHAIHSAYSILEKASERIEKELPESPIYALADVPLTLAWFKGIEHYGEKVSEHLKKLQNGNPHNDVERSIHRLLYWARQRDAEYVRKSLEKKDILRSDAWKNVRNFDHLNDMEKSILNVLRSLSHIKVAQQFATGLENFEISGETPRSIYAKIGPSIESIWISKYIEDTSEQLSDLLNLLLGVEIK